MSKIKIIKIDNINEVNKNNKKKNYEKLLSSPKKIKEYLQKRSKYRKMIENEHNESNDPIKFKSQFKKTIKQDKKLKKKKRTKNKKEKKKKKYNKNDIDIIFKNLCRDTKITKINKKKLISIFKQIVNKNNNNLSNKFIKEINREQLIYILNILNVISLKTKAPTPLLKYILYTYLTSKIKIIKL